MDNKKSVLFFVVIIFIVAGVLFYIFKHKEASADLPQVGSNTMEIFPFRGVTFFSASSGKIILPDSMALGSKFADENIVITKIDTETLMFKTASAKQNIDLSNTIKTGKGRNLHIVFEDSTNVWMSSNTALNFPSTFNSSRIVQLQGEAYFEVKEFKDRPFIVKTNQSDSIRTINAHFDITSYNDGSKFYLAVQKGNISINDKSGFKAVYSGEIAEVQHDSIVIQNAQFDHCLSWQKKEVGFNNDSLGQVILSLTRWYAANFVVNGSVDKTFNGTFNTSLPLSTILKSLNADKKLDFSIQDGNIVIVSSRSH